MTRVLITGAGGMLGRDLAEVLSDIEPLCLGREDLDITDPAAVKGAMAGIDVVINAAAYTDVDGAESNPDQAIAVNAHGPRVLADQARQRGARLIQISTDYVFRGDASTPYPEDTPTDPASVYGQSKAAGERNVLTHHPDGSVIVRTAWLYGQHGKSFPRTLLEKAASTPTFSVVTDQIGQPTWSADVAHQIRRLVEANIHTGIFHATNSGQASWWEFARELFAQVGLDPERIQPTTSAHFPRPAPRPQWSVLDHAGWKKAGLPPLRSWQDALTEATPECFSDLLGGEQ
jgi:dTDP-4-dehydrorhamnose reductase